MLEKPTIRDEKIIAKLRQEFGLQVSRLSFLPLGADLNTAVYRASTAADREFFVKLRRGPVARASVAVPRFLHAQGLRQIIPAIFTQTGQPWADLDPYKMIVYPFVIGQDGFAMPLSAAQRVEFGRALRQLHTTSFPAAITAGVDRESFSPRWRRALRKFWQEAAIWDAADPVAQELAALLIARRPELAALAARAEQLAAALRARPPAFILCHGDIHAWNLLLAPQGALFLVDWDTLIFAPKERDLMFVGSGLGGSGHSLAQEERLFYQGYGPVVADPLALAYYRYERIIEDIVVGVDHILQAETGGADRPQSLRYIKANFQPRGALALARRLDQAA